MGPRPVERSRKSRSGPKRT